MADDDVVNEYAKNVAYRACMEGAENGGKNRSAPWERLRLETGSLADLERAAYSAGWNHGRSTSPAESPDEDFCRAFAQTKTVGNSDSSQDTTET